MQNITFEGVLAALSVGVGFALFYAFARWVLARNLLKEPYGRTWHIVSVLARVLLVAVCFLSVYEYISEPRWFYIGLVLLSFEFGVWMISKYFKKHRQGPEPVPR